MADQVTLTRSKEQHAAAVSAALGDIEVGERLLQAILDDPDISGSLDLLVGRFKRSHRTDLLALAAQHLPGVLVCEECSEGMGSSAHEGQRCPAESAVCLTCTPHAGPYAGEWEGTTLQECIVDTPCSVLRALCDNYEIALPSRANPSERRGIDIMTSEPPPELENDRTAMMLGLVPDKRTPEQRLLDCILTDGESAKYRYGASALPHSEEEFEAASDVADRTGVARDDISAERSGRKRPLWAVPAEEIQSRRDEWLPHLEGKTTAEIHRWAGFEGLPVATAEVWLWAVVHPALDLAYGPDGRWGLENGPQEVPTQLRSLVERWRASGDPE
ncbi:hypothetical protein [Mycobacteroides abscessus]|uniref:hypothetical protein n=1 Tax=Mycobacteroides abscessus TaxID=36809 RepID=UPI0010422B77|nr:hypothetical protein [Mycobacteroides abscessus]